MSTRLLMAITMIGIAGWTTNAFGQGLCPSGSVGVVNPGDGPDVCVKWGEQFPPVHLTDFFVDFIDEINPDVRLDKGSLTWELWTEIEGDGTCVPHGGNICPVQLPRNLGTITTPDSANYRVKILQPDGDRGADTVGAINFGPTGANHSSLETGSKILCLGGDLFVKDDAGAGGEVNLELDFGIAGDVTAKTITLLDVDGVLQGSITAETITQANIGSMTGNIAAPVGSTLDVASLGIGTMSGDVTVNSLGMSVTGTMSGNVTATTCAGVSFSGEMSGNVYCGTVSDDFGLVGGYSGTLVDIDLWSGGVIHTVFDFASTSTMTIGTITASGGPFILLGDSDTGSFDGTIVFEEGLPSTVPLTTHQAFNGTMDFNNNDNDAITITIDAGGSGIIKNIATLTNGISLTGNIAVRDWTGTITMATLTGNITTLVGFGTLGVGGKIHVTGDCAAGSLIDVGPVAGVIEVDGILSGEITGCNIIGSAGGNGRVTVTGAVTSTGELNFCGITGTAANQGLLHLKDDVAGTISMENCIEQYGTLDIDGEFSGTAELGSLSCTTLAGTVDVSGRLSGNLNVSGDVDATSFVVSTGLGGDIQIDGALHSDLHVGNLLGTGRIIVDGLTDAGVIVDEGTTALTQINLLGGLGANGFVVINDTDGNFDAEGDIQVGEPVRPPVAVTFDGSIMIKGVGGQFWGGDLIGDIGVDGCHATTDDLDICVCGTNVGSIAISQNNCTNQVVDSCVSGCP